MTALVEYRHFTISYRRPDGTPLPVVTGVDLDVHAGECLAIVGESGAGKSQLLLAPLGLTATRPILGGSVQTQGAELVGATEELLDRLRGSRFGVVFQDAGGSLTPHLTLRELLGETLHRHRGLDRAAQLGEALALLNAVGIDEAERRLEQYPHELSGGLRQRVAIALALASDPAVLIADEPTTALDVTVQAGILALFSELQATRRGALVIVTHDLGVVAALADRVAVMYAGAIVEVGDAEQVLLAPHHPYTRDLLAAQPRWQQSAGPLATIAGQPPDPGNLPPGCPYAPRCAHATPRCTAEKPPRVTAEGPNVSCWLPLEATAR